MTLSAIFGANTQSTLAQIPHTDSYNSLKESLGAESPVPDDQKVNES